MAAIGQWVKGYTVVCGTYGHQLFGFNLSADLMTSDGRVIDMGIQKSENTHKAREKAKKAAVVAAAVETEKAFQASLKEEAAEETGRIQVDFEGDSSEYETESSSSSDDPKSAPLTTRVVVDAAPVEQEPMEQEQEAGGEAEVEGLAFKFEPEFAFAAHTKAVTTLARHGRWLFSGSDDERVNIYDMITRREYGALIKQNGTITDIVGVDGYTITASSDGTIVMWSQDSWEAAHTLKGHNAGIESISLHPSGKLLLSVGLDSTLRLWDLKVGRQLVSEKLRSPAHLVSWSASGAKYAYVRENVVCICDTASNEVVATIPSCKWKKDRKTGEITYSKSSADIEWYSNSGESRPWSAKSLKKSLSDMWRVNSLGWLGDEMVYFGGEGRRVQVVDVESGEEVVTLGGHGNRIKSIQVLPHPSNDMDDENEETQSLPMFVTASSDGKIRVFDPAMETSLAEFDTLNRPTCLAVVPPLSASELPISAVAEGASESESEPEPVVEKRSAGKSRRTPTGEKKKTKIVKQRVRKRKQK